MRSEDQIDYIRTHLQKPVVIIGMMGAGKTTLARKLSQILKWPFIDSDQEIEKEQGRTVRAIFEAEGEAHFRQLEKEKIAGLLKQAGNIVSVGGGAITVPETVEGILAQSLCLWVDAPISVLASRTASQGSRPLLNGRNVEEALSERMEQRRHLYERAHLKVDGHASMDGVADNALGQIYNYLVNNSDEI